MEDERDLLASYHAVQEVAESLMDVAAMLMTDVGQPPRGDYDNLEKLAGLGVLSTATRDGLSELNGLRNRIVHEYDGLSPEIAIASARRLGDVVRSAVGEVRAWLSKQI